MEKMTKRFGAFPTTTLATLGLLLTASAQLCGQPAQPLSEGAAQYAQSANSAPLVPKTNEEIDRAIVRLETRLGDARGRLSATKATKNITSTDLAATEEELTERDQLLQQFVIALDQHARYLRNLKDIRRLNQERITERETWRGFALPPTAPLAEQL